MSSHPGGVGCRRARHVPHQRAQGARRHGTRTAPSASASTAGSSTGSAATLKAPRASVRWRAGTRRRRRRSGRPGSAGPGCRARPGSARAAPPRAEPAHPGTAARRPTPRGGRRSGPGAAAPPAATGWRPRPRPGSARRRPCPPRRRSSGCRRWPALVHRLVLRALRVGAHRRGVHQGRHAGANGGVEHPGAAVNVHPAGPRPVVRRLDGPRQVHDDVGALNERGRGRPGSRRPPPTSRLRGAWPAPGARRR